MSILSFSDIAYEARKRKTRRQVFLERMDAVLPWTELLEPVREHYPKRGNGRPPIPADVMLRIHFMQLWFNLSDPAMEDRLYDVEPVRRFAGIGPDEVPDETTICRFRHFLQRHGIQEKLFAISRRYLEKHNLLVKEGSVVDATIITAPSSTKNKHRKRDPEMRSTKKGNQYYFGMKAHVGTDINGLVHSVEVTSANVHDVTVMESCLHGEEKRIYGDKGYVSRKLKKAAEARGATWRVLRKATRSRKLNCADMSFNKKSNRTRARVEHVFGVIKHLWGYRKVRYKSLAKNAGQVYTMFALANFYMVRYKLPTT